MEEEHQPLDWCESPERLVNTDEDANFGPGACMTLVLWSLGLILAGLVLLMVVEGRPDVLCVVVPTILVIRFVADFVSGVLRG